VPEERGRERQDRGQQQQARGGSPKVRSLLSLFAAQRRRSLLAHISRAIQLGTRSTRSSTPLCQRFSERRGSTAGSLLLPASPGWKSPGSAAHVWHGARRDTQNGGCSRAITRFPVARGPGSGGSGRDTHNKICPGTAAAPGTAAQPAGPGVRASPSTAPVFEKESLMKRQCGKIEAWVRLSSCTSEAAAVALSSWRSRPRWCRRGIVERP
jgi:hypothetical protein